MSEWYRDQRAVYVAPPPPRERKPCRLCGEFNVITNVAVDGDRFDACCWRCANLAQHLPALGHAIARFCRRAEVAGLVEAADKALGDAIELDCNCDFDAVDAAIERHERALTRLARLAEGA